MMNNKKRNLIISIFITLFVFFSSTLADKIKLSKFPTQNIPNQTQALQQYLRNHMKYKGNIAFENRSLLDRVRNAAKTDRTETVKVLALRVEFVEDSTSLTTGNGKMDLAGFLTPEDGLLYDPPHTRRYFERHLQGMRNYYYLNSLGALNLECKVMPNTVRDCYQLPHPMQYYGDTASIEGIETGLCRLMRDAISIADQDPALQFSDYDVLIIFHAGSAPQSDLRGDSPFDLLAGTIPSSALDIYLGTPYILADEGQTRISSAMIMPEMMRQDTSYEGQVNILGMFGFSGTLYHEFTHLLGSGYDLYDVTGWSMGVGAYSLMGTGAWLGDWSIGSPPGAIPGMLDAFHKVNFGWVEPYVINMPLESIPIFAAEMDTMKFGFVGDSTAPVIVKIPISETEYFLLENRQTEVSKKDTIIVDTEDGVLVWVDDGEYDFFLPGSGILIWHVDEQIINEYGPYNAINIFPEHKGVDLEEADGIQDYDGWSGLSQWDYQYYGSPDDPFCLDGYNSSFSASTTPNSDGYFGKSHINVTVSSNPDTIMLVSMNFNHLQPGFPIDPGRGIKFLSSHFVDLNQDGINEIVVADSAGRIFTWNSDGSSYAHSQQGSFAQLPTSLIGTPAIGDVAGDDKMEIICAGEDGKVYIYSYTGLIPSSIMTTNDRILASPVLADLDADGKKEIIIGSTDMKLYVWKGDGSSYPGFPLFLNSEIRSAVALTDTVHSRIVVLGSDNRIFLVDPSDAVVVNRFPLVLSSSALYTVIPPVIGDVDADGEKEIIAIVNSEINHKIYIIDFSGKIKYTSTDIISTPVNSAPALADLDNDGFLDIVVAGKNKIYAFNYNGTLKSNYPIQQDSTYSTLQVIAGYLVTIDVPYIFNSSPIVGDINNDSILDIIIGSPQYGLLAFDGQSARKLSSFPIASVGSISASPFIADIDNDAQIEIVIGSDAGIFYIWEFESGHTLAWNQYLKDSYHSGLYTDIVTAPNPAEIVINNFYAYPNPAEQEITIRYKLGSNPQSVKINLLDIFGEMHKEIQGTSDPLIENEVRLSLTNVPSGIYLLRIEAKTESKKEIKFYKFAVVK